MKHHYIVIHGKIVCIMVPHFSICFRENVLSAVHYIFCVGPQRISNGMTSETLICTISIQYVQVHYTYQFSGKFILQNLCALMIYFRFSISCVHMI